MAPVGLCSQKRAEYLMGAAAVAGGAIYVGLPEIPGLTDGWDRVHLCVGTLPNGEHVPTRLLPAPRVIGALRAEADRLAQLQRRLRSTIFEDEISEIRAVAADLEAKLA